MKPDVELNLLGLYCPEPIFRTMIAIDKMREGQVLKILVNDPAAEEDLKGWSERTGHNLIRTEKNEDQLTIYIRKAN